MLIGQYAKASLGAGSPPKIVTLDLAPAISVGRSATTASCRDSASRSATPQTRPAPACGRQLGDQAKGQTAMENCLQKAPDVNVVYTINEPAAPGRSTR